MGSVIHAPLDLSKRLPFIEIPSFHTTNEEIIMEALDRSLGTNKVSKNEDYGYDKNDRTIHDSITITPLGNDRYNLKFTDVKLSYFVSFAAKLGQFQARYNKATFEKEREEAWVFMPPEPEGFNMTLSEEIKFYLYYEYEDSVQDIANMYNECFMTLFYMYEYKYDIEGWGCFYCKYYRDIDLFYFCYLLGWREYTEAVDWEEKLRKWARERLPLKTQEHRERIAHYQAEQKKGLLQARDYPKLEYLQKILNTNTISELDKLGDEVAKVVNIVLETREYLLFEIELKTASLKAFEHLKASEKGT